MSPLKTLKNCGNSSRLSFLKMGPMPEAAIQRVSTHQAHFHPSGCPDEEVDEADQDPDVALSPYVIEPLLTPQARASDV